MNSYWAFYKEKILGFFFDSFFSFYTEKKHERKTNILQTLLSPPILKPLSFLWAK